ncbi:YidC/Oxa1 family membrane protein insertase [Natranaerovirga pectinivora]|uniref:YidC/Oxa1 family membrane protein insertase n=1 Tax=Natranaerovirga pectinivora TaxID=682400 RepID=A0A4R3ML45_9FIRM|nr:membrane protein insertase YidC [Natranaerovirga pectinivora]TCT15402.1 YidC/Oxa1 family membrane protein insertase [Natranaerovirga pectinivora]
MNTIMNILQNLIAFINLSIGDVGLTIVLITLFIKIILMPLSIKQKNSMDSQKEMATEMNRLKEKYKDQKEILDRELYKLSGQYASGMMGCFLSFIQLPIMLSLYRAIISMPMEIPTTLLLPWISDLKSPDTYFIIPVIACIIQLLPNVFGHIKIFKDIPLPKSNKSMLMITLLINGIFVSQVPVIIGIYFITSGLYTFFEQLIYYSTKVKKTR